MKKIIPFVVSISIACALGFLPLLGDVINERALRSSAYYTIDFIILAFCAFGIVYNICLSEINRRSK